MKTKKLLAERFCSFCLVLLFMLCLLPVSSRAENFNEISDPNKLTGQQAKESPEPTPTPEAYPTPYWQNEYTQDTQHTAEPAQAPQVNIYFVSGSDMESLDFLENLHSNSECSGHTVILAGDNGSEPELIPEPETTVTTAPDAEASAEPEPEEAGLSPEPEEMKKKKPILSYLVMPLIVAVAAALFVLFKNKTSSGDDSNDGSGGNASGGGDDNSTDYGV